jgi:hypothetical protein
MRKETDNKNRNVNLVSIINILYDMLVYNKKSIDQGQFYDISYLPFIVMYIHSLRSPFVAPALE